MTTAAADALRQALADAPDGLHVGRDGWDELDIFDGVDRPCIHVTGGERGQATTHLIGLLLAAAPHVVNILEALDIGGAETPLHCAITEAAQAMEAES